MRYLNITRNYFLEEYVFKIVLLGEKNVGKSSLIRRYVHSSFEGRYTGTIGLNVSNKKIIIKHNGESFLINIVIYDIEAETNFEDLFTPFAQGSVAAMFVFDVTRNSTLESIDDWVMRLEKITKSTALNNAILIGNKIDLLRVTTQQEGRSLSSRYRMLDYIETSAKENKGVEEAFELFANRILKSILNT